MKNLFKKLIFWRKKYSLETKSVYAPFSKLTRDDFKIPPVFWVRTLDGNNSEDYILITGVDKYHMHSANPANVFPFDLLAGWDGLQWSADRVNWYPFTPKSK